MQIPVQVIFEGTEPSEAVRSEIEREVERLEVARMDQAFDSHEFI